MIMWTMYPASRSRVYKPCYMLTYACNTCRGADRVNLTETAVMGVVVLGTDIVWSACNCLSLPLLVESYQKMSDMLAFSSTLWSLLQVTSIFEEDVFRPVAVAPLLH